MYARTIIGITGGFTTTMFILVGHDAFQDLMAGSIEMQPTLIGASVLGIISALFTFSLLKA